MSVILERGFSVKAGCSDAAVEWVRCHEEELAAASPEGVEHLGFYAVTFESQKGGGDWRVLTRLECYAALDRMHEELANPESRYSQLNEEFWQFVELRRVDNWSRLLMKSVQETVFRGDLSQLRDA